MFIYSLSHHIKMRLFFWALQGSNFILEFFFFTLFISAAAKLFCLIDFNLISQNFMAEIQHADHITRACYKRNSVLWSVWLLWYVGGQVHTFPFCLDCKISWSGKDEEDQESTLKSCCHLCKRWHLVIFSFIDKEHDLNIKYKIQNFLTIPFLFSCSLH